MKTTKTAINRRSFLSKSATAGAGLLILRNRRLAFAYEANSKLNIAGIGVGGQGRGSLDAFHRMGNNLVALCDVDTKHLDTAAKIVPGARLYTDWLWFKDLGYQQVFATRMLAGSAPCAKRKVLAMPPPITSTLRGVVTRS